MGIGDWSSHVCWSVLVVLETARRWTGDRRVQVGVQIIQSHLDADHAGETFSDIADATIRSLLPQVEATFAERHGRLPETATPAIAVLALGKYGGRELTHGSDLDLVFIYDAALDRESDGPKPLMRSEEHTSELQSLMRISYAVLCLKKK